jgi:N-acetylglucosamine-6-phosphate deacetylase
MTESTIDKLLLFGGDLLTPSETFVGNLWIAGDQIQRIERTPTLQEPGIKSIDVSGCYVTPGLIDLQVNGAAPCNFWEDPKTEEVSEICRQLISRGVTCILPTLITDDIAHLQKNQRYWQSLGVGTRRAASEGKLNALSTCFNMRIPGLHLEGPCISPSRLGVHPPQFAQPLSLDILKQIISDQVVLVTLAPELDLSGKCIKWLIDEGVTVTLGHSNATYDQAISSFALGIHLMTHTFNALPPLHHRAPGAVGAALLDENLTCCVIADGLHVDPAVVKIIFKLKGADHLVLVSDVAQVGTSKGGLVGSSIFLDIAVRNMVNWGIASFPEAIKMATLNPAQAIGIQKNVGSLAKGMYADIVVWDKNTLDIKHVVANGQLAYSAEAQKVNKIPA